MFSWHYAHTPERPSARMHQDISEIAYRRGFNDLPYFNVTFRARFDMAPGEWRRELQIAGNGLDQGAAPLGAD